MGERRRVRFRQTEVARAIRAARDAGAGCVVVCTDGSIQILVEPPRTVQVEEERAPVKDEAFVLW